MSVGGIGLATLALTLVGAPDLRSTTALSDLRASLLRGDLVTVERGRALLREAGQDVARGSVALLDDLSRLVRCLPMGPVPESEDSSYRSVRALVRLERIRLEQLLKDGAVEGDGLLSLLAVPSLFHSAAKNDEAVLVRWPAETERWDGELVDPRLEASRCPLRPGLLKEPEPEVHRRNTQLRASALRTAVARILPDLEHLPKEARTRVSFAYVRDAARAPAFELSHTWMPKLTQALSASAQPYRTAGILLVARLMERAGKVDEARPLFRAMLEDPELPLDEDSRVRARLVGLEEPSWPDVYAIAKEVKKPRAVDEPVLANAEARALYALQHWEALKTFGRLWLRGTRGDGVFDVATRELLIRLALKLNPSEAMAWTEELGPKDQGTRMSRFDGLGRLALESNNLELATAIYDQLRLEATENRARRGPNAWADEARWIAQRALIEFQKDDGESFAGFIDELVGIAKREEERPLARYAPHREIARLCQELLGRLANTVPTRPERRVFAALLLEAAVTLSQNSSRWKPTLEKHIPPLAILAGPYAAGRDGRVRPPARRRGGHEDKPVRQLGEVVVPRLPPRLEAIDVETPLPTMDTFLVYELPDGEWKAGSPWSSRVHRPQASILDDR